MDKKIRVAFIKYGGLSAGGTEKFLQTIAANLNRDKFSVDFFYCDSSKSIGSNYIHPDTDTKRKKYLMDHGVTLRKFIVGARDLTSPFHNWKDTNFWEIFNESEYDIIQSGRAGHKEFPFNKIRKKPIVDSIHLKAGVDNQWNISRVMHLCEWSAKNWVGSGGDKSRMVQVSHPMEMHTQSVACLREELSIKKHKIVYGFHQRKDDNIFSRIPLIAFKQIASDDNHFIIMGGSLKYVEQAKSLGILNISFIPHNADSEAIYTFLRTLDVYAHGRSDGEVNSTAMAEAMYFSLPIVSHRSKVNNGHIECIADAGIVVAENDVRAYAAELKRLQSDFTHYAMLSTAAKKRFNDNYELKKQMQRIEDIYEDVILRPFPHPLRRYLYSLHWTQNIRIWLKWVYLKSKYILFVHL